MRPTPTPRREPATRDWHSRPVEDVLDALDSGAGGLSQAEAERRLESVGPNEIDDEDDLSPLWIFVSQFRSFLIYLLVLAALLSLGVGLLPGGTPNYVDAGLILLILVANGVFGFVQDYRAEEAMRTLRAMSSPQATVIRDGEKRRIDADGVVPGDVVVLRQGDAIPADARLLEATNLETMEAPLTGESTPVTKETGTFDADAALAERSNMVYMDTNAVAGRGTAVVVATGMDTVVGGIATQIHEAESGRTPFEAEVDRLGRRIGYGIVGLIALIAVVQFLFTNADVAVILMTAITLAVAAVPEGLPAVVTLTLALGSQRMAQRKALVRRLPAVEALGSVDVILTDKTGTLTENQMTVRRVAFGDEIYEVSGTGLNPEGSFASDGEPVEPSILEPVLRCGAVCNDAERAPESADVAYFGDPTEVALLVSAQKAGVDVATVGATDERVRELSFTSERKRMTVVVAEGEGYTAYTKGAPATLLERCDRILVDGEVQDLTAQRREELLATTRDFAGDALRVLGFARKTVADPDADAEALERGLVFLGLQGMLDPPREEVADAVADCRDAGIRVVMATGDNLDTATAVAREIGFDPTGALSGPDLAETTDDELRDLVEEVEVFARVAPEHKVQILKALQANGHRVAMTGDGINDAPGLRNADVGISMGVRGTDVAKEASDMVLQDDNFVTIRDAIAEGRGIFDNTRKFVNYLLSANAGEVLVVFVGVVLGSLYFPSLFAGNAEALILTPVMLLWINLVTDGLPAIALGADPKAENIMDRAPRHRDDPVIDRRVALSIGAMGALLTLTGLALFFYGLQATRQLVLAQTLLFTFLVAAEVGRIQLIRTRYRLSVLSNRWLLGAVASSWALQLLVLYTPLSAFFDVVPLDAPHWLWIGGAFLAFVLLGYVVERLLSVAVDD